MNDVTRLLSAIERGDTEATEQLLPLVYRELRELAAQLLAREPPGQTLQATALVHEAYLRLASGGDDLGWDSRGHFFGAAAEAMRRILVENARRTDSLGRGGNFPRVEPDERLITTGSPGVDLLALDEALEQLAAVDGEAAELVKLRYFAGLTTEEAGEALKISARSAYQSWAFARAWLYRRLHPGDLPPPP